MFMASRPGERVPRRQWVKPQGDQEGLRSYVTTLKERRWLIVLTVLVTILAAVAYLLIAREVYEAEADLLITPVSDSDALLSGLSLIRESSDPTRDVETASRLVASPDVAARVKRDLRDPRTPRQLLADVRVEPLAQSNIVAITAEGSTADGARDLANGFAKAAVTDRTEKFHQQLDAAIEGLRDRGIEPAEGGASASPDSPTAQLARLVTLRGGQDPTMRLETRADAPVQPSWPQPLLSLAAGVLGGLLLGVSGAFALQILDPRLRREEQLKTSYGLPILARVPKEPRSSRRDGALSPERLSPSAMESYRTLRATLAASRRGETGVPSVLVTSPSASEGKTTTAINLASSLALAGNRVIMIEADLRRPAIGEALGVMPTHGTGSVLLENVSLRDALVPVPAYGNYLQLLLADQGAMWMIDQLFLPAASELVAQAKTMADYVIVDSPPISEVSDALPLARSVDEVLIVVRLGKSHLTRLDQLAEMLDRQEVEPVGFAVVGVPPSGDAGYYYMPTPQKRGAKRRAAKAERERQPA